MLVAVLRVFKTQRAQADFRVVNSVSVKMDYIEWLTLERGFERGKRSRREQREFDQRAEFFDSGDERQGADAMVNIANVCWTRTDQQHANRQL